MLRQACPKTPIDSPDMETETLLATILDDDNLEARTPLLFGVSTFSI